MTKVPPPIQDTPFAVYTYANRLNPYPAEGAYTGFLSDNPLVNTKATALLESFSVTSFPRESGLLRELRGAWRIPQGLWKMVKTTPDRALDAVAIPVGLMLKYNVYNYLMPGFDSSELGDIFLEGTEDTQEQLVDAAAGQALLPWHLVQNIKIASTEWGTEEAGQARAELLLTALAFLGLSRLPGKNLAKTPAKPTRVPQARPHPKAGPHSMASEPLTPPPARTPPYPKKKPTDVNEKPQTTTRQADAPSRRPHFDSQKATQADGTSMSQQAARKQSQGWKEAGYQKADAPNILTNKSFNAIYRVITGEEAPAFRRFQAANERPSLLGDGPITEPLFPDSPLVPVPGNISLKILAKQAGQAIIVYEGKLVAIVRPLGKLATQPVAYFIRQKSGKVIEVPATGKETILYKRAS